jgi:hypothetical protein
MVVNEESVWLRIAVSPPLQWVRVPRKLVVWLLLHVERLLVEEMLVLQWHILGKQTYFVVVLVVVVGLYEEKVSVHE